MTVSTSPLTRAFLPWVRQGLAASVTTVDTLGPGVAGRVRVPVALRVNGVAVRPPTPIADQVTTRNTSAATSRQSAPSPSRIFGTDAADSRAVAAERGAGACGAVWDVTGCVVTCWPALC